MPDMMESLERLYRCLADAATRADLSIRVEGATNSYVAGAEEEVPAFGVVKFDLAYQIASGDSGALVSGVHGPGAVSTIGPGRKVVSRTDFARVEEARFRAVQALTKLVGYEGPIARYALGDLGVEFSRVGGARAVRVVDETARRAASFHRSEAIDEQPWPEFFEGCGYRALDTQGARLREAIGAAELPEAKKDELRRRLHIYEDSPAPGPDDTKGDE